jgi:hypothetical protein
MVADTPLNHARTHTNSEVHIVISLQDKSLKSTEIQYMFLVYNWLGAVVTCGYVCVLTFYEIAAII